MNKRLLSAFIIYQGHPHEGYIMILAHFLNTWSSDHELIETQTVKRLKKT